MSLHEDLKAYLDGELDALRTEEIRVALERDPELRHELSELKSLTTAIQASAAEISVRGLDQTLAALERTRRSRHSVASQWLWTAGLVAGCVVIAAIFFPVFSQAKMAAKRTLAMAMKRDEDASAAAPADEILASPAQSTKAARDRFKQLDSDGPIGGVHVPGLPQPRAPRNHTAATSTKSPAHLANPTVILSAKSVEGGEASNGVVYVKSQVAANVPVKIEGSGKDSTGLIAYEPAVAPINITLAFDSTADGLKQVRSIAGKYLVPNALSSGGVPLSNGKSPTEVVLDVPETEVVKVLADLKKFAAPRGNVAPSLNSNSAYAATTNNSTVTSSTANSNTAGGPRLRDFNGGMKNVAPGAPGVPPGSGRSEGKNSAHDSKEGEAHAKQADSNIAKLRINVGDRSVMPATPPQQQKLIRKKVVKTRRLIIVITENPKKDPVH